MNTSLPQGLHGAAHGGHAVHQHGKAQQDLPHMAGGLLPADHPQQSTDGGHQGRQSGGTQQSHPAAAGEVAEDSTQPVTLVPKMAPSTMPMA